MIPSTSTIRNPLGLVAIFALGLSIPLGLSACASDPTAGYSFKPSFRDDVTSVNVQMFQNQTFYHGLESELSSAVITEFRRQSPYKILSSEQAQTTLTGTIVRADLRRLSVGRDSGIAEDVAFLLTIDFSWKNTRTGKVIASRKEFSTAESFVPARNVNEPIEQGQQAAVSRLARDLVNELRSSW